MSERKKPDYDAIIIGAGLTGMYQCYLLRQRGFSVRVIERNGDVGGTWHMNRYPGCRLDSESYTYGYSFLKDLLQEWDWKEEFAGQPALNEFFSRAADKMDVRKDIQFNTRVTKASFDDENNIWTVELDNAETLTGRFLLAAMGFLSIPNTPKYEGMDLFRGESFHSYYWPHEADGFGGRQVDFTGKKVAVMGTGSTGVQIITEVAKSAGELFVLQRDANWCAPLGNRPLTSERMAEIKQRYDEIFAKCDTTMSGFPFDFRYESALDHDEEQRNAVLEEFYGASGFGIWIGHYADLFSNAESNRLISEFIAGKIRQRVKDPEVAEKLIPKDHGFGLRRVPMESRYYEVYNQDNVTLMDIREDPVAEITPNGILFQSGRRVDLDIIIYATGFDAVLGAFKEIDIHGVGGKTLKEVWADGPYTYLGLQVPEFPNLFTLVAAHNGASFCNLTRCSEAQVRWMGQLFAHIAKHKVERVECTVEAADAWTEHVYEVANATLFPHATTGWFWGQFGGKNRSDEKRHRFLLYFGGNPLYRQKVEEVARNGYEGMIMKEAAVV